MKEKVSFVGSVIAGFELPSLDRRLSVIRELLNNHSFTDISVLGQFKAGKSSLINSLIGFDMLPTGVIPLTSVITLISYGPEEKVTTTAMDGKVSRINPGDIGNFITEKGNPGNAKGILRVEVETPLLTDARNLRFIDTPGLGSVYRSGTETAMNHIPGSGIVVVVISAIQPVSDSDVSLIREALEHSPYIIVVLSKTDLLDERPLKESREFVIAALLKAFGKDFSVAEYSVRNDEPLHRDRFWEQHLMPFSQQKEYIRSELLEYKFSSLVKSAIGYLRIAHEASQKKFAQRKELRGFILDERTMDHIIRKDLEMIGSLYTAKGRALFEENLLRKHKQIITNKLESEYRQKFNTWEGNISRITALYESWLKASLSELLSEVIQEEDATIAGHLAGTTDHFNHYVKALRESLNGRVRDVFGLDLPEQEWEMEIPATGHPDIFIRPAFDIRFDMLGPFFPMLFFRGWVKRYLFRQIEAATEKNLYRLINDLTGLTQQSVTNLMGQALNFINTEVTTIAKLLEDSRSASKDLETALHALEKLSN